MTSYVLTEKGKQRISRTMWITIAIVIPLSCLPAFIVYHTLRNIHSPQVWIMFSVFLLGPIALYFYARHVFKSQMLLRVTIEEDKVKLERPGKQTISIQRKEVKQIIENEGSGINIDSIDPTLKIFVPFNLENYDDFKIRISLWSPLVPLKTEEINWLLVISTGIAICLILFGGFYFTKSSIFVWIFIGLLLIAGISQWSVTFKTAMHAKSRYKRISAILSILLLIYMLVRLLLTGNI